MSTERIEAIKQQQRLLLAEIDRLDDESAGNSYRIHELQQDYNKLVDEESEMTPGLLPDPFTVLPPELWPHIIPDYMEEVLKNTLVSLKWRQNIFSMPSLWTRVDLDERIEDYLNKAITCIHFSRPLKIDLHIDLSFEAWKEIAPMILGEGYRIKSLTLYEMNHEQGVATVTAFDSLPALRYIKFPFNYRRSGSILEWWQDPDQFIVTGPMDPNLLQQLCSKINLDPAWATPELCVEGDLIEPETVTISRLDEQTATFLNKFRNLKRIRLYEVDSNRKTSTQKSTDSLLPSITNLLYRGLDVTQAFQYIGNTLTRLDTEINICDIASLLDSLVQFPVLERLALQVNQAVKKGAEYNKTGNSSLLSIKILKMKFIYCASDTTMTQESPGAINNHEKLPILLFDLFAGRTSLVEEVELRGELHFGPTIRYIQTLRNIKSLYLDPHPPIFGRIHGVTPEFEELATLSYQIPAMSIDWAQHQHLQKLLRTFWGTGIHVYQ